MRKILFVCHGNICRSPMAEFMMKNIVHEAHRDSDFEISSAAATTDAIGRDMHTGAKRRLDEAGVPYTPRCARLVSKKDYGYYDLIIVMDEENMNDMNFIFEADTKHKINKLLEYCGLTRDVADPWYTHNFNATYDDILAGCSALFDKLK